MKEKLLSFSAQRGLELFLKETILLWNGITTMNWLMILVYRKGFPSIISSNYIFNSYYLFYLLYFNSHIFITVHFFFSDNQLQLTFCITTIAEFGLFELCLMAESFYRLLGVILLWSFWKILKKTTKQILVE